MRFAGRLRTALLVLLVLLPMASGPLCAFCEGCRPAETSVPPCHASSGPEVEAPDCCDDAAALPAEHTPRGLVPQVLACSPPAAEASGQVAMVRANAEDHASDPPLLHAQVRLHTLHSVFLI